MATQHDRVLSLLRKTRRHGLNSGDLYGPVTADGGKPIVRLAARIRDLRNEGYRIRSERRLNGTTTYFLDESGEPRNVAGTDLPPPKDMVGERGEAAPPLFEPDPAPVNAALEDYEAA